MLSAKRRSGAWPLIAGILLSTNGAARAGEGVWSTNGPAASLVSSVAIDPADATRIYAAVFDTSTGLVIGKVYRGSGRGATWEPLTQTAANKYVLSVAADPSNAATLYAFVSSGDLRKSTDGGATWSSAASFGSSSGTLAFSPADPAALYVAGANCQCGPTGCLPGDCAAAIFRSRDGGATFDTLPLGTGSYVTAFTADPTRANVLYAGTDTGLFTTLDGGATWGKISQTIGACSLVSALALDPHDNRSILVGFFQGGATPCGGAYLTADAGGSWKRLNGLPIHATSFLFGPEGTGILYAAAGTASGATVYRSGDGGTTWTVLAGGLSGRYPQQLVGDASAQQLYVSTDGGVFDLEVLDVRAVAPPAKRKAAPRSVTIRQP
ncbi:MAG TPA: hypothetical protein VIA45_08090 [Thermoanaerobaculia bacterium]